MNQKQRTVALTIIVSVTYLVLRWRLLLNPGMTFDLDLYKEWLLKATEFGVSQIYRTSSMDYPPFYAYILKLFGWLYTLMAAHGLAGPRALTTLVKLPPLLFDFGIASLLWRCASLEGKSVEWRAAVAAGYLFNPAVLFLSGYWGAPDPIHSFFILACFVTVGYGARFWFRSNENRDVPVSIAALALAWTFLTLAALMKPLGLPYFPLLLFFSLISRGVRGAVIGMATSISAGLLVFSPFLARANALEVFSRVLTDIGAMPFTSSNAHNFWWLIGGWYYSEVPWIGPLTPTHVGLILFGLCFIALSWKAWRQYLLQNRKLSAAQTLATAAMVSFSFFMFSTHLHEHHLFATVPLLASFAVSNRVWRNVFLCVSVGVFINCWLHDSPMDTPHWPYTIGGPTSVEHPPKFDRPYYVAELVAIWSSVFFNLVVYSVTMAGVFWPGKRGWLARLSASAENAPAILGTGTAPGEQSSLPKESGACGGHSCGQSTRATSDFGNV